MPDYRIPIEGLLQKAESAGIQDTSPDGVIVVGRHEQDGDRALPGAQYPLQFHTANARHPHIDNQARRCPVHSGGQKILGGCEDTRLIPGRPEKAGGGDADGLVIVDNGYHRIS
jgi:hypothetical protein